VTSRSVCHHTTPSCKNVSSKVAHTDVPSQSQTASRRPQTVSRCLTRNRAGDEAAMRTAGDVSAVPPATPVYRDAVAGGGGARRGGSRGACGGGSSGGGGDAKRRLLPRGAGGGGGDAGDAGDATRKRAAHGASRQKLRPRWRAARARGRRACPPPPSPTAGRRREHRCPRQCPPWYPWSRRRHGRDRCRRVPRPLRPPGRSKCPLGTARLTACGGRCPSGASLGRAAGCWNQLRTG